MLTLVLALCSARDTHVSLTPPDSPVGWALLSTLHRKQAEVWELMNMRCGAEKEEKVCRLSYHDGLGTVQILYRVH